MDIITQCQRCLRRFMFNDVIDPPESRRCPYCAGVVVWDETKSDWVKAADQPVTVEQKGA